VDTTKSTVAAPSSGATEEERLAKLEERYRHDLLADEERQELRDRVLKLRRRSEAGL
jgi:hypothetical protein